MVCFKKNPLEIISVIMIINNNNNKTPNFGIRIDESLYNTYRWYRNYNGIYPDRFVLSRLPQKSSQTESPHILDLGAGQGRNAICIAENGYHVSAVEINTMGLEQMNDEAIRRHMEERLSVFKFNLLDSPLPAKNIDFAFMSHISQHFSIQELQTVLKNVKVALKTGKDFVFDALVRTDKEYKEYDGLLPNGVDIQRDGAASFYEEDIINAARSEGFQVVDISPFKESGLRRAKYEKQNSWGGTNLLYDIFGYKRKPVKLKWFVLRKP